MLLYFKFETVLSRRRHVITKKLIQPDVFEKMFKPNIKLKAGNGVELTFSKIETLWNFCRNYNMLVYM